MSGIDPQSLFSMELSKKFSKDEIFVNRENHCDKLITRPISASLPFIWESMLSNFEPNVKESLNKRYLVLLPW